MDNGELKQFKLTGMSGETVAPKEKKAKEKEEKTSKRSVLVILLVTVVISLIFALSEGGLRRLKNENVDETPPNKSLFGSKVYEF